MPVNSKRRRNQARLFLLRWHRRVGVAIALGVIVLVVTGIPLNHTSAWQLDRVMLSHSWLLKLYNIEASTAMGFPVGEQWLIQAGAHLFLDDVEVARCDGALVGAGASGDLLLAACTHELVMLNRDGALIEQLGGAYGLPVPLSGLAVTRAILNRPGDEQGEPGEQFWLRSAERWFALDLQMLTWAEARPLAPPRLLAASAAVPEALQSALQQRLIGEPLTLERVLLDVHSGRILGAAGVWLADLAGLLLLVLAVSGCYVWLSKPGRFRRR